MIRTIEVKLNAAHPELPLPEATALVGSPSAVFLRGVPRAVGAWCITSVHVAATYPDSSTHSIAAVQSADGVWVATLPATDTSGRVAAGFQIEADGIDERGDYVNGYCLGICDFAIYSRDIAPAPGPAPSWVLHYFATPPQTPRTGDVATFDGTLKFYNGSAWLPFADIPAASSATPQIAGTGAPGSSTAYARGDHVHPAETALGYTPGQPYFPAGFFPCTLYDHTDAWTWDSADSNGIPNDPELSTKGPLSLQDTTYQSQTVIGLFSGNAELAFFDKDSGALLGVVVPDYTDISRSEIGIAPPVLSSVSVRGVEVAMRSVVEAHTSNTTIHVTAEDKQTWNGKQDAIADLAAIRSGAAAGATAYQMPNGGIPAADMAAAVQTSLSNADTAVQPSALPYALGAALTPDANYAIQLANRTVNLFAPTSMFDPLVIKLPASIGTGLARDCFLRVDLTDGAASLANVSFANSDGSAAVVETPGGSYPTLADGKITILYISETATNRWLLKAETVEVAL